MNKALQAHDFLIVFNFYMQVLKFHKILHKNTFLFNLKCTISHNLIFISKHSLKIHLKHLHQPLSVNTNHEKTFQIPDYWITQRGNLQKLTIFVMKLQIQKSYTLLRSSANLVPHIQSSQKANVWDRSRKLHLFASFKIL